jgi:hypothetical protein
LANAAIAVRRHVKIVGILLPGRAGGRGEFEDEAHSGALKKSSALLFLVVVGLDLLLLLKHRLLSVSSRERHRALRMLLSETFPDLRHGEHGIARLAHRQRVRCGPCLAGEPVVALAWRGVVGRGTSWNPIKRSFARWLSNQRAIVQAGKVEITHRRAVILSYLGHHTFAR